MPGIFIGYDLHAGIGRAGELLIEDWYDPEHNVASEAHVKRFTSKEIGMT